MSNTAIWDKVKTTDPGYTKDSTYGRKMTSICSQYQLQEATKMFGPYGKGFGFESCELDLSHLEALSLVIVKAVFFYVIDGEKTSFTINNSWPVKIIKKRGEKPSPDEDFAKKAETNTMSKALSRLGFSADVFLGKFEDSNYVEMASNEKALETAEDKIEEQRKQREERQSKSITEIEHLNKAKSINELHGLYKSFVARARMHSDAKQEERLKQAKDKAKLRLSPPTQQVQEVA
jgi:hypothetical protein